MISASANRTNAGIATRGTGLAVQREASVRASETVHELREALAEKEREIQHLKNTISGMETGAHISPRTIIAEVSRRREMPLFAIMSGSRAESIVSVRHEAIYEVARRCPWVSLPELGRMFGKDHTTILSALNRWPQRAEALGIPVLPLGREKTV